MNNASDFIVRMETSPDGTTLRFAGTIDEQADLSFFRTLRGKVRLNLRDLQRINSFGVKSWYEQLAKLPEDVTLELLDCPPPFVDQLNLLDGFVAGAKIVSFLAPYICDDCEVEIDHPVDAEACRRDGCTLNLEVPCPSCGRPMELNEVESLYLRFLEQGH